ncbi:MAG: acetyl-CoA hydrolase/transferase C-terminal domain-containing protein [Bacillota bacterium]
MKKWQEIYRERMVTPEEAVQAIKPGHWVTSGLMECRSLTSALANRADLVNVTYFVGESFGGILDLVNSPYAASFRVIAAFLNPFTQQDYQAGKFEFMPCYFSTGSKLFLERIIHCHAAFVQVSPPDDFGYCSLGNSVDYIKDACDYVPLIIAEVNRHLPRTCGDTLLHVSRFNAIVERDQEMFSEPPPQVADIHHTMAGYLSELVENGSTIEAGAGNVVQCVVSCLTGKRDLGIHSEMFTDALRILMEAGAADGGCKTIFRHKAVANMAFGSAELYRFINNNLDVELHPAGVVLQPDVIAKNHKMTAINTGYQVDLFGQVNAEYRHGVQMTGVGGQTDFNRGAAMSPGGKAIIAITSTTSKGKSNIVAALEPGTPVTSTRNDIHYVVTEYGVANLIGRTTRERARELINVAAPQWREELSAQARQLGLL